MAEDSKLDELETIKVLLFLKHELSYIRIKALPCCVVAEWEELAVEREDSFEPLVLCVFIVDNGVDADAQKRFNRDLQGHVLRESPQCLESVDSVRRNILRPLEEDVKHLI